MIPCVFPEVVGEVPFQYLDLLPIGQFSSFEKKIGIPTDEPHPMAIRLGELIASMAGVSFSKDEDVYSYHSGVVKPGNSLRSNDWHRDNGAYIVTNCNPTEFLIAGKFLEPEDIVGLSDLELINKGMFIWQPKPYQVVFKPHTTIHRCQINNSGQVNKRTMYALLSR